jgi:APA family basic amino acid/polyamine antiporter
VVRVGAAVAALGSLYYAIANASAWTLTVEEKRPPRVIVVVGLVGCLVLAFTLPLSEPPLLSCRLHG